VARGEALPSALHGSVAPVAPRPFGSDRRRAPPPCRSRPEPPAPVLSGSLAPLVPALALLLAAVPLAVLLERVGFFDAAAALVARRASPLGLWVLAAATTVVLNLDTTVVLLTPLYVRIARQRGADAWPVAVIPLLLAGLASSVLPVSNLTTLVLAERLGLSVAEVAGHLGLPSVAAVTAGWWCYRRRYPHDLPAGGPAAMDGRALACGGAVVAGVLVGFTGGPAVGVPAWAVALAADVVLVALTRWLPWRSVPVLTAVAVAVVAAAVDRLVPPTLLGGLLGGQGAGAAVGAVAAGTAAANAVNNLPAVFAASTAARGATWAVWGWLLGVNAGAVLLPGGALANLLWWRVARRSGVEVTLRRYVGVTVAVALPALVAATVVLAAQATLVPA
jgi:arsenical pump membrane protein